jgi:hypothetical protein
LRDDYARTLDPSRALAAETLTVERTLSDLVNQAYGLTPAEMALMWQTAPLSRRSRTHGEPTPGCRLTPRLPFGKIAS